MNTIKPDIHEAGLQAHDRTTVQKSFLNFLMQDNKALWIPGVLLNSAWKRDDSLQTVQKARRKLQTCFK